MTPDAAAALCAHAEAYWRADAAIKAATKAKAEAFEAILAYIPERPSTGVRTLIPHENLSVEIKFDTNTVVTDLETLESVLEWGAEHDLPPPDFIVRKYEIDKRAYGEAPAELRAAFAAALETKSKKPTIRLIFPKKRTR